VLGRLEAASHLRAAPVGVGLLVGAGEMRNAISPPRQGIVTRRGQDRARLDPEVHMAAA
jgi:hypothetical protein